MKAVEIKNLDKWFEVNNAETLMGKIANFNRNEKKRFYALKDVNLSVNKGEFVGIIGANGSGKSTLLRIIAKTLMPNNGSVRVYGKVVPFLDLGLGFQPELTARENILLYLSVMGLSKTEIESRFDEILKFAELENFQNMPIKDYSSGMHARLAFSSAIQVDGDIYLIDEVLAVGDASFQKKCFKIFEGLKKEGKTIVLVSHNLNLIRTFCDCVFLIDNKRIISEGKPQNVIANYKNILDEREVLQEEKLQKRIRELEELHKQKEDGVAQTLGNNMELSKKLERLKEEIERHKGKELKDKIIPRRFGSGKIRITKTALLNKDNKEENIFKTGDTMKIRICYYAHKEILKPEIGVAFYNSDGLWISGPNTKSGNAKIPKGHGLIIFTFEDLPLLNGDYSLTFAIHNYNRSEVYDCIERKIKFRIKNKNQKEEFGSVYMPCKWEIKNAK